jgi:hypothetical protein
MSIKKELNPGRSIRRIDLSLPVVQGDSYEVSYTIPPSQNQLTTNLRSISRQKPLVDNNKKNVNQTARIRSPARLKHLIGPIFVNLLVDMASMTAESTSTMPGTVSSPLNHSNYSGRTFKGLPTVAKCNKRQPIKDDGDRSRSSSGDRLLYESLGSFDDHNLNKIKNGMWQNIHHPQLTSTKTLHTRRMSKPLFGSNEMQLKASNTTSFDNLSQESVLSVNERLYERIEQLTRNYFPTIQKIRHTRPPEEIISNRVYLHREDKQNFMLALSRTRVVR